MKRRGWLVGGLLLMTACGEDYDYEAEFNRIIGSDYDITVTSEGPPMELDVGQQVMRLEDQINEHKNGSSSEQTAYTILLELCRTEPGKNCDPARFPNRIPRYLWPYGCVVEEMGVKVFKDKEMCTQPMACVETPVEQLSGGTPSDPNAITGNGCVDVKKWIEQIPDLESYTTVSRAVRYDVSDKINFESDQVKKVSVDRVVFHFKENSLTYAIPDLTSYVGDTVSEEEANDAKKLIADGAVTKFGTLPETPAGFTGNKTMQLEAAGKDVLSDKLKAFAATIVGEAAIDFPPETDAAREDNCKDPNHLTTNPTDYCESFPKPDGKVKFTVEMTVTFTVNAQGK